MSVAEDLERFIGAELSSPDRPPLRRDDDLVSLGIVDSLGILRLMAFIEEKFGFSIGPEEVVPENFRDINSLSKFIEGKARSGKTGR